MSNLDKKKGLLNVFVSVSFRIILLFAAIFVRRYLIKYVGNEVNGINSLYLSIIGFLSVAELGIGNAITFCMYKPIVAKEWDKVSALYQLLKKLYLIIGGIILTVGLCIMPFLPYLAKGYQSIDIDLYSTFLLMLISVVLTYFYSAKTSLINAYKNDYITTTISSLGNVLQYVLQIIVVVVTRSFVAYLFCRIIAVTIQWAFTEIFTRKEYKCIISKKSYVTPETKTEVIHNFKAMFMHKVGYVLVNTVDSMIISAFIGVVVLGKYSNYTTIMTSMVAVLNLFFTPLTSVIGHLFVEESKQKVKSYYNFFYGFNYVVGVVFFLGYYAVIDNIIEICFGNGLELSSQIVFVITLNYFIQFMRKATLLFRDATGTFYNDRWKPIFEGGLNLILSIIFVQWFDIVGVIVATIITNLFICHVIEPYVLHKYAFCMSAKKFCLQNYVYILGFTIVLPVAKFCMIECNNAFFELMINGMISLGFSIPLGIVMLFVNADFRNYTFRFIKKNK